MGEMEELRREVDYLRDELHKEKLARHRGTTESESETPEGGPTPEQAARTAYEEAKARGAPNDEAGALALRAQRERFSELRDTRQRENYLADVRKGVEEGTRVREGSQWEGEGIA